MTEARRFNYFFEFDRRDALPVSGTPEQQATIRASVARYSTFDSHLNHVMWLVARKVKQTVDFIPITFSAEGANGWTFPYLMLLNPNLKPNWNLEFVFWHETGHLVGRHLFNPIDKTEEWADQFAFWAMAGRLDGPVTQRLGLGA